MNTKFTAMILVAAIAMLASGLTIIPTQSAAALVGRQPGPSISLNLGSLGIFLGSSGIGIDLGGATPVPMR